MPFLLTSLLLVCDLDVHSVRLRPQPAVRLVSRGFISARSFVADLGRGGGFVCLPLGGRGTACGGRRMRQYGGEEATPKRFLHTQAPPFISCLPIRMVKMRTRHSLISFFPARWGIAAQKHRTVVFLLAHLPEGGYLAAGFSSLKQIKLRRCKKGTHCKTIYPFSLFGYASRA